MAFLRREAVQGHIGAELEDVFLELALLQLGSEHAQQNMSTRSGKKATAGDELNKAQRGANTAPCSLLSFHLQPCLKIVVWHPHRWEKPLFTLHQ